MNNKNPEILAPGGDFNSAVHALNSGADAVYIGLTSFSARKKAKNFTLDQLRSLKTFCNQNSKKIYVAINTLLNNIELEELYPLLMELEEIEIDAIIVQDLGLATLIKRTTNLEIHASTQLAVHNIHGVQVLQDLGFSRAVLSRELTLNEIKKIKDSFPKMELEIFIHGALCYGFSGLCLASSKILGRSANRGECGQICRTWFYNNGKKEYCFSMNDLSLEQKVLKLKEIGIESLKIEGRMKGPGYTSSTAELYYNILNGKDFNEALKRSQTEFNRSGADLFLNQNTKSGRVNVDFPGHLGIPVGDIIETTANNFTVKTKETIENRDGLMVLKNTTTSEPIRFAANILDKKDGTIKFKYNLPQNINKVVYKISNHDKHLKEEKPQKYKPWKHEIKIDVIINFNQIEINTFEHSFTYPIHIEKAIKQVDVNILFNKMFYAGGETKYRFLCNVISNVDSPFIQSSLLKEVRNKFQKDFLEKKTYTTFKLDNNDTPIKQYYRNKELIPFVTDFTDVKLSNLTKIKDSYLLPLAPVNFDSQNYLTSLLSYLHKNKDIDFIIGLNNISHLGFIKFIDKQYNYFCDYGLFSLNNFSRGLYNKLIPNLLWVTSWIEEKKDNKYPPLFISRTCFKAQKDGCPPNCKKKFQFEIIQNGKKDVIVRDCLSYTMTTLDSEE